MRAPRLIPLLAVLALAGCGGDPKPQASATTAAPKATTGSEAERVIRRWADTLRKGDERGAAELFALPSKFANGTPVLRIQTKAQAFEINKSLTCGATVTAIAPAGRFTRVTFALSERPGGNGDCAGGGTAQCMIRVVDGRISEWYRLPNPGEPPIEGLTEV